MKPTRLAVPEGAAEDESEETVGWTGIFATLVLCFQLSIKNNDSMISIDFHAFQN